MVSKNSLKLFHKAAKCIPAYQAFLNSNSINPAKIRRVDDFRIIPLTDKKNYLLPNKRSDLIWPKDLGNLLLFCATSGSTGEPYYFPRNEKINIQYSYIVEDFLKSSSRSKGRVLVLMGFGLGVWIGGVITLQAFEIAAKRMGISVAILPVGYNKAEIFKALSKLSPEFDQTILVGYPPFTKELIDEAVEIGIDLKNINLRLLFAAEAFTESFRNYVCEKAGIQNPLQDTLNIYGTADIGAMAYETPLSILIRRLVIEDPLLFKDVFGQYEKTPTLAQYNPKFVEFETVNGQIVITGNNAMPLIRYAVGDNGGTFTYQDIHNLLFRYDIDLEKEIELAKIKQFVKTQPFVFVYERVDLAATLHGIIIYPEFIKDGLLDPSLLAYLTQKFTMSTKNDIRHNQFLQINIELQKGIKPTKAIQEKTIKIIRANLIKKSSEFAEVSKSKNSRKLLDIKLWPNGHPRYFAPGTKQKWVEKI